MCPYCNNSKKLDDNEICYQCGCALEIENEIDNNYELEEILEQIEELTKKAQKLIKNK
jgi:glutaredoxin